jgi:hypothetical protein
LLQIDGPPGSGKTKLVIGLVVRARAASLVRQGGNEPVEVLLIGELGNWKKNSSKNAPQKQLSHSRTQDSQEFD